MMVMFSHLKLDRSKTKNSIRSIALVAMLLAILIIQEEFLIFIPNVQLTVILIIVYAQFLDDKELYPLVIAYVIIDSMIMGGLSFMYTPSMMLSWSLLAFVSKKVKSSPDYVKLIIAVLFGFVYGWSFLPATAILQKFSRLEKFFTYIKFDLIFEVTMAISGLATYLVFYNPLMHLFRQLYNQTDKLEY